MRKAIAKFRANDWCAVVSKLQNLLQLQLIDTSLLQLQHRLANLAERANVANATATQVGLRKESNSLRDKLKKAKDEISVVEVANKKCETAIVRYAQQLKTVIAPREAEALQHEIETMKTERSKNDDVELLLFDTIEQLEQKIDEVSKNLEAQIINVRQATVSLDEAVKVCEHEKQSLLAKRQTTEGTIDEALRKFYESKKLKRTTPAVAILQGSKCQSCHLDLSVVELSALKKVNKSFLEASSDSLTEALPECPNCDCLLVI